MPWHVGDGLDRSVSSYLNFAHVHQFHAYPTCPMGQGKPGGRFALGLSRRNLSGLRCTFGCSKPSVRTCGLWFGQIRLDSRLGQRRQDQPSHLQRPKRNGGRNPSYRTAWRQRQWGLVLVDDFYEPSYETGKAVRWKIQLACGDPFGIACLWDRWKDPVTGEWVVSFSMLTVNADAHPVMRQFHKPGDEKRTPVIIAPDLHDTWLSADIAQATRLLTWSHMPELVAMPAPLIRPSNQRHDLSRSAGAIP